MLASIDALSNRRGAIRLDEDEPFEDEKLSLPNSLPQEGLAQEATRCEKKETHQSRFLSGEHCRFITYDFPRDPRVA
jgi:hypothetical protein